MRAGVGQSDVWPSRRYDLSGFVARDNPSTGVHDPVAVRALYLAAGEQALIVSPGVLGFMPDHAVDLRRRLAQLLHVPERTVLLAATHTHSAPATMRLAGCGAPAAGG